MRVLPVLIHKNSGSMRERFLILLVVLHEKFHSPTLHFSFSTSKELALALDSIAIFHSALTTVSLDHFNFSDLEISHTNMMSTT